MKYMHFTCEQIPELPILYFTSAVFTSIYFPIKANIGSK